MLKEISKLIQSCSVLITIYIYIYHIPYILHIYHIYHICHKYLYHIQNQIYIFDYRIYKVCQKQYVASTITTFRIRFNQYKSNIKLYSEGRRAMKQEKLISHFFTDEHHGTYDDIKVQIIDYRDANDQERREDFWIFNLNTLEPNGLNNKRAQKN